MHPKALLEACADLVGQVLRFDHPADAVVSRHFRDNRSLGPRERATLAETAYGVVRRKLLYEHLARSGSGPRERRLAILGFAGPRDFLLSALNPQEKAWLEAVRRRAGLRTAGPAPPQPARLADAGPLAGAAGR